MPSEPEIAVTSTAGRSGGSTLVFVFIAGCCLIALYVISMPTALPTPITRSQPQPRPTALASTPVNAGQYAVVGAPTISADFINRVLEHYHSPAAGKGQALYDLGVRYGIDPAYALAFFMHESSFGTAGEARKTLSLGNLRCIPDAQCVDQERGGYAAFPTWEAGFEAWYKLIRDLYIGQWHLITVDQIIPKYAPNADHNNEQHYVSAVKRAVETWRAGKVVVA